MTELNHDDGKCITCGGHGHFTAEPAFIYGTGKLPCKACGGSGFLKVPTQCEHCGSLKQPLRQGE